MDFSAAEQQAYDTIKQEFAQDEDEDENEAEEDLASGSDTDSDVLPKPGLEVQLRPATTPWSSAVPRSSGVPHTVPFVICYSTSCGRLHTTHWCRHVVKVVLPGFDELLCLVLLVDISRRNGGWCKHGEVWEF